MTMIKSKNVIVSFYTMYISFWAGGRGDLNIFILIFCYHYIPPPVLNSIHLSLSRAYQHTHTHAHYSKQDPGKKKEKLSHAHIPYRLFSGYSYT